MFTKTIILKNIVEDARRLAKHIIIPSTKKKKNLTYEGCRRCMGSQDYVANNIDHV